MPRRVLPPLKEEYFSWLYNHIREPRRRDYYVKLCKLLHAKPFKSYVHNDENRCADGIALRNIFSEMMGLDESHTEVHYFLKGECTIFEMMVALAKRMNELMYDLDDRGDHTPKWFLEMIRNLGLSEFTDETTRDNRLDPVTEAEIDDTLEKLVSRAYDFYGRGGLFPLKRRPPEDQTTVEIWYQLMRYLDENYGM